MNRLKPTCYLACAILLLMIFGGLITQPIALAVSEGITESSSPPPGQESTPAEEVEISCKYPVLRNPSGTYFVWDVELRYKGGEQPHYFDLRLNAPAGFDTAIRQVTGEEREIARIALDPKREYTEMVRVFASPFVWSAVEPGEYVITMEAVESSLGELKNSIELTAIITPKPDLALETTSGRLNVEAIAGKDNFSSIIITNIGSAELEKITFFSETKDRPPGWIVTFSPEKIDSLPLGSKREVEVNIKPPQKTISGDYMVTIEAEPESKLAWDMLEIRVTVLTPTIWGWVGVGIVIVVIVGLVVMFMRLGRR
ncbi:MAG TPA: hypothetical protein G4O12_00035 [Dehalococcoidia bacterium]|nr:hypothetical protein [Dehalococcoidia bacterium]